MIFKDETQNDSFYIKEIYIQKLLIEAIMYWQYYFVFYISNITLL